MTRRVHRLFRRRLGVGAAALLACLFLAASATPAAARCASPASAPSCCCPPGAHDAPAGAEASTRGGGPLIDELHRACGCVIAPLDVPRAPIPADPVAPAGAHPALVPAASESLAAPVTGLVSSWAASPGTWVPPPRSLHALRVLFTC